MRIYLDADDEVLSQLLTITKGIFDSKLETDVIGLSLREVGNEIQRRMKIIKFKKILVPKTILRYDLTEKGIKMESVMRVLECNNDAISKYEHV